MSEALPPDAVRALAALVADARESWWVIGGAAVALHGVATAVGDLDLLLGEADAGRVLAQAGLPLAPGPPHERFRSALFGRLPAPGLTLEIMAGFELRGPEGWAPVRPLTREPVLVAGATLFVPARGELAALLRRIGRPKDLARAALLDQANPRSAGPNA